MEFGSVEVANFNDKEETTCVEVAILLRPDRLKRYLVVPLLSLITGIIIFPLFLYWQKKKQRDWLYYRVEATADATHIYVEGRDGNIDIVKLQDFTQEDRYFCYRFINFEWS